MDNEEAKKILDILARKCGYKSVELKYAHGALNWHAYVQTQIGQYSILFMQKEQYCKCISVIGSGHSYAECLKNILEATSSGHDVKIDNLNFHMYESDEVFLKKGMTEEMLKIEIDLENEI